ncbi:hypothetical protein MTP10_13890 [Nonomuraea sp. 3-1Str]|uniref:hypothetical protein n=1 Tax=Nonomuraea sp. 3-1Str TaxID=2929801 RepID=UPI002864BACA|nr:hypothetical protein [Nonomuraea sp. 3-1Str]MDR8409824.1 hypothetical protein [Nonomuraea sp. 3-1Str]
MDFTICEFLGHVCDDNASSLDWGEEMQVAAHAHLLNRWLDEDAAGDPANAARLVVDVRDHEGPLLAASLLECGILPLLSPDGPMREPFACEPVGIQDAVMAVRQALFRVGPSRRLELLSAALDKAILDWADEAVLVAVTDPATGEVVRDETHVVFAFCSRLIRISVSRVAGRRVDRDPACSFAGHWCAAHAPLLDAGLALAEIRLRAVCAGTILRAPLNLAGHAAFRVGLAEHELPPAPDLIAVRQWWSSTEWCRRYEEEYLEDEYPVPDDPQAQEYDLDEIFPVEEGDPLELGDPAQGLEPTGWIPGEGMKPLTAAGFLAEVEAFAVACREEAAGHEEDELVSFLLDELLHEPVRYVGGPQRRLLVWADAEDDGRFWRTEEGGLERYGEARRVLVVGPSRALYLVFKEEKNC